MKQGKALPHSRRLLEVAVSLALLAVLLVWGLALELTTPDREATAARKRAFAQARVTDVLADNAAPDTWTEGRRIGQQLLEVELRSGPYRGTVLECLNYPNGYSNVDCRLGTRVIVRLDLDDDGNPYIVSVPSYDRGPLLVGLVLLFAGCLVVIGGRKGVMALLGLGYTLAALWWILVPMLVRGASPILTTIVMVALTTAASLIFLTGLSQKTLCAVLGCVGGVGAAGILSALAGVISPINGFNMSEAENLVLQASQTGTQISGLLVSGILIASLGAVMDVAMSIASSCHELRTLTPGLSRGALFRSGMNIGRDAMGTMANTLILAFAGSSLNMLLLFQIYDYPMLQLLNTDAMVIEVIRGLAGSLGIILTVPLVAALSASIMAPARSAEHPGAGQQRATQTKKQLRP